MHAKRILLPAILLVCVTAFAQEPAAGGDHAKATVYVYRYKQFVGAALEPSVYCDDAQLARMTNGRYFEVKVDPGKHTFYSNDKQSGIDLDAKAGQEYFIRLEIATGFMKGHGRLMMMAPEQASYELQSDKLKPLDTSKVVAAAMVSTEEAHPAIEAAEAQQSTAKQNKGKMIETSEPQKSAIMPQ